MSDNATTMRSRLKIGLSMLGVAALSIFGGMQLRGPQDFTNRNPDTGAIERTSTGAVQRVNGFVTNFRDVIPLSMTGGKLTYNMASVRLKDYLIVGSGSLSTASIHWVKAPAGGGIDIVIGKCASDSATATSSGTVIPNGNNLTNSTGAYVGLTGTGAVRVNGVDCVQVKSLTNPTSSGSGYLIIGGSEDPSE